jgi:DNA-binding IclR family transcriptional regulator
MLDVSVKTDGLGLNEITQKTGASKSTVFRVLATLLQLGYVSRRKGKYFVTSRFGDSFQ